MQSRARALAAIAGTSLLATGCGPTTEDLGRMALLSVPVWMLMGSLAGGLMLVLWRRTLRVRGIDVSLRFGPWLVVAIGVIIGVLYAAATMGESGWAYIAGGDGAYRLAALFLGFGYVAATLVTWRVWFAVRPAASFRWAQLAVLAPLWVSALVLAIGVPDAVASVIAMAYLGLVFLGFFGISATVLLVGLAAEALLATRRSRSETAAASLGDRAVHL